MEEYADYLQGILLFGLLGTALLWAARACGFFYLHTSQDKRLNPVRLRTVLTSFGIYLGMTLVVAPALARIVIALYSRDHAPAMVFSWLQLVILLTVFALFYLSCKTQNPQLFAWIWKNRSSPFSKSILTDIFMGILTWIISFPLIICIGQLVDMFLYFLVRFENFEQVAVRYLKTTLESPPMLAIALFTILLAAPMIEEFLFRGCLQSYLKRYMTPKKAILFSALCFSLFHYAPSQGIGNISLVATLFVFALFLGFIYERQGSLFASVALHMTFNTVSTVRILAFPESS